MLFLGFFSNQNDFISVVPLCWLVGWLVHESRVISISITLAHQEDDLKELSELMEMGKNKRVPMGITVFRFLEGQVLMRNTNVTTWTGEPV